MFIHFIEINKQKRRYRPNSSVGFKKSKEIRHKSGDMVKREKRSLKSVERSLLIPSSIRQKSTFARQAYKKHDNH
jgi:hypothetical protein